MSETLPFFRLDAEFWVQGRVPSNALRGFFVINSNNYVCSTFAYNIDKGMGSCRINDCSSMGMPFDNMEHPVSLKVETATYGFLTVPLTTFDDSYASSLTIRSSSTYSRVWLKSGACPGSTSSKMYACAPMSGRLVGDTYLVKVYANTLSYALDQWSTRVEFDSAILSYIYTTPGSAFGYPQEVVSTVSGSVKLISVYTFSLPGQAPTGNGVHLCTMRFTVKDPGATAVVRARSITTILSITATSMTSTAGNQFATNEPVLIDSMKGYAQSTATFDITYAPPPFAIFAWPKNFQRHVLYGPIGNGAHRAADIEHVYVFGGFGIASTSDSLPTPRCGYAFGTGLLLTNSACTGIKVWLPQKANGVAVSTSDPFAFRDITIPAISATGAVVMDAWVAQVVSIRASRTTIAKACTTSPSAIYTMTRIKKTIQFADGDEVYPEVEVSGTIFDFDITTSGDASVQLVSHGNGIVYAHGTTPGTCAVQPVEAKGSIQILNTLTLTTTDAFADDQSINIAVQNVIAWDPILFMPTTKVSATMTSEGDVHVLIGYYYPSNKFAFIENIASMINVTSPRTDVYNVVPHVSYWQGEIQTGALGTAYSGEMQLENFPTSLYTCPVRVLPFLIELPQLVNVTICCAAKIAVAGNAADVSGYLPTSSNPFVVKGIFSDGRQIDFTSDSRAKLVIVQNTAGATVTKAGGVSAASSAGVVTVQANITLSVSKLSATIVFQAVAADSIQVSTTKFDTFNAPMLSPAKLLNIQCTSPQTLFQRIQSSATLHFSDQGTKQVSLQDQHLTFAASGATAAASVSQISKGVFALDGAGVTCASTCNR